MTRVNLSPRHRNSPRPASKNAPAFLQWLRTKNCCIGGTCAGRIEAAHVRTGTDGGMGSKPSDRYAIPMCASHHAEQHMAGEATFSERHNVNMKSMADHFWRAWPGRIAWEKARG